MIRSQLVHKLAEQNRELLVSDIENIVDCFFRAVSRALVNDSRVELRGFGAFSTRQRRPREARNPRTGASVSVGAKRVPHFKVGKNLAQRINAKR
jgi:integration host factor subunit beta